MNEWKTELLFRSNNLVTIEEVLALQPHVVEGFDNLIRDRGYLRAEHKFLLGTITLTTKIKSTVINKCDMIDL